jgi:glycine hydroxymethyltransferase
MTTPSSEDGPYLLLHDAEQAAARTISLVASENYQSMASRLPMLLDGYNRYYFRSVTADNDWGFRGAGRAGALERDLAVPLLQKGLEAPYVSVRPLSGLSAMAVVFSAFAEPGARCLTLGAAQGGHSATAQVAARTGFEVTALPGDGPHRVDLAAVTEMCGRLQPHLIYLDQSNGLFPYLDLRELRAAVHRASPATVIHADCSHYLGLVLGGVLPNPLHTGADTLSSSTHKTFPGPQKGLLATESRELWDRLSMSLGALVSSHHFGAAASLGLALREFEGERGREYAHRTVQTARALGAELHRRGLPVHAAEDGYTQTHQLWLDPASAGLSPEAAALRLEAVGIRVNELPHLPGIEGPAIRLGVQEATWFGMGPRHAPELADLMTAAALRQRPVVEIRDQVAALRASWPGLPRDEAAAQTLAWLSTRLS